MADTTTTPGGRVPMPPAKRKRLQQMFEHGSRSAAKGDFKYATEMFTQCVLEDPGNLTYVASFIGNLQKQYNNNKKGSKMASLQGMGVKGSIKKASMQKDWNGVIASGLEMLKLNPWDASALEAMSTACENLEFDDCQLAYLKAALDADIADVNVNRMAGRALARMGKYDEAIMCWVRVQKAKPQDEEARKAIGDLAVEKTITKGGYEDAESTKDARVDKQAASGPGLKLTPEQTLEKQIAKDPANTSLYLQLAEMYAGKENFKQAEEVLQKALSVSGGEVNVRERLEDMQIRYQKTQLEVAKRKSGESPETAELYKKLKTELNNTELAMYRTRCERYPANLGLKYELGYRLQKAKMFKEAIQAYQGARGDPQRKGNVLLQLGECFHEIKQHQLAISHFEQAIVELGDGEKDAEHKNWALYCAGKLLLAAKDLDKSEKYLSELAGRDFSYKDVAECLDKIRELRDKG